MPYEHELIAPTENMPFKLFLFEGMNGNYIRDMHWHHEIEIFAVMHGDLDFYIGETLFPLPAGHFILVNSNEVHQVRCPHPNQTIVLQIPLAVIQKYTGDAPLYFSHDVRRQDAEVMELLRALFNTYTRAEEGASFKMLSHFYEILHLLVTRYRIPEVSSAHLSASRGLDRLSRITSYMQENASQELTLELVADLFGYTPTHLAHMFRTYARTTFKTCLTDIRLNNAYRMLLEDALPLGEIAMRCGFAGSKAFSRAFSRRYGILPSEFRRRARYSNNYTDHFASSSGLH